MNDFSHLKDWLKLPDETKRNIFNETGRVVGLPVIAIEKDWWVVHTLSILPLLASSPTTTAELNTLQKVMILLLTQLRLKNI